MCVFAGARRARSERCGSGGWPRDARARSGCLCLPSFCIERHRPACRAEFDNPSVASHTSKIQHSPNASAHACKKGPGRLGLRRGRREAESHPTGPGRRRDRPTSRQAAFHPSSGGRSREACRYNIFLQTENNYTNRELSPCQPRPPRTCPLRQRYIQHSFVDNPRRVVRADGARQRAAHRPGARGH